MIFNKIIFPVLFVYTLASCKPEVDTSPILTINHDDFISCDIQLSEIADTLFLVQYDSVVIMKAKKNEHNKEFIFLESSEGVLKYDRNGRFLQKIGSIGQGPTEYNAIYRFGLDKLAEKVYIYSNPKNLLIYDFNGLFLDRIKLESFPDFFSFNEIWPLKDDLCFTNSVPFGISGSKPYYWGITNGSGELLSYKQDTTLVFSYNGIGGFGKISNSSYFNNSIIYWNHFNDTIFRLNNNSVAPAYVWDKGKKRIKHEVITNFDSVYASVKGAIKPSLFLESDNYLFMRWEITIDEKIQKHITIYDKRRQAFADTYKPIINDITGGTLSDLRGYFKLDGYEFLEFMIEPYELIEQLLSSNNSQAREIINRIDEEGNQVLVLVRLKKTDYKKN